MARRRHLTPKEICANCNMIAREKRMSNRTPWSVMAVMCSYAMLTIEGYKAKRLLALNSKVNEMEEAYDRGEIDIELVRKSLYEKAEWTFDFATYTEDDIKYRKGSFEYWFDSVQIEAQNNINNQAMRYMLFYFNALIDLHRFGKERLTRIYDLLQKMLKEYQTNREKMVDWQQALMDETGLVFDMPIDPLTQTAGSVMTG